MKKTLFACSLGLIFAVSLCFGTIASAKVPSITVNKLTYDVVDGTNIPDAITSKIDAMKDKIGAFVFDGGKFEIPEDNYYIYISIGMKPTSGYSIAVTRVEDNEGKTVVYVNEKAPSPEEITAQMITYPYTVIRISKIGMVPNFVVVSGELKNYDVIQATDNTNSNNDNNKITYENVATDKMPLEFANISYMALKNRGFKILTEKSKTGMVAAYFILVQAGEKSTGGFSIKPVSVTDAGGKTLITVEETFPNPKDMVIQSLTYPKFVIKVSGNVKPDFEVRDLYGEEFKNLGTMGVPIITPKEVKTVPKPNKTNTSIGTFIRILGNNLIVYVDKKQMKFIVSDALIKSLKLKSLVQGQKLSIKYIVNKNVNTIQEIKIIKK
jgi:hypothetical protein